ncbi:MAG: CPBP family intramembrane metalloprotease [Chitinophagaceae bacterium]|nr:CPBP family intramembrane metalloprotease [Chitinophagaceae bacterium]
MAIIATSLLFSLIHMSVFLFLSRALLGFVLGLMYQRSKNIWVNIIAHFLNNTVAVIQLFWISRHSVKVELDKLDPKVPIWGGLVAVVITWGLFLLFEKVSFKSAGKLHLKNMTCWNRQAYCMTFLQIKTHNIGF